MATTTCLRPLLSSGTKVLLLQFLDFLMIVLMIVGVVSLGLQKWIELSIIGVAFVFVFDLITNRVRMMFFLKKSFVHFSSKKKRVAFCGLW
jgi:hypothetical protein